jgi:hypothetical protein
MPRTLVTAAVLVLLAMAASAQPIQVLNVNVSTANESMAGTDNDVHLILLTKKDGFVQVQRRWNLDTSNFDDFEQGATNGFRLTEGLPDDICEIKMVAIWKSTDDYNGGWKLGGLHVFVNDDPAQTVYFNPGIHKWMEDGDRNWNAAADFPKRMCIPPPPVTINIEPGPPGDCIFEAGGTEFDDKDADCDGVGDSVDQDDDTPGPDTDGDRIPDEKEKQIGSDPNDPDSDDDGLEDGIEDANWNGKKDDGELDAKNPDTDGDGWNDGPTNVRTHLILSEIACANEEEDVGVDELFVVIDDVRFPADSEGLDGQYDLEEDETVAPLALVASRARGRDQSPDYQVELQLWEDDVFDWTDDHWTTMPVKFGESGSFVQPYKDLHWYDDTIYDLTFFSFTELFWDPDPFTDSDSDRDGITDKQESAISSDPLMRGLADPAEPDIFLEMDWVGADQEPEEYSKIDVVSQFFYHGFPIHLDDGKYGGGGQNIAGGDTVHLWSSQGSPNVESFIGNPSLFAASRQGVFHYVVGVNVVGDKGLFGQASSPRMSDDGNDIPPDSNNTPCRPKVGMQVIKSDYLDHVSDLESIVLMHELGHTLGLGHRPGDEAGAPEVVKPPRCPAGTPCGECDSNVSHYWVQSDSDTAMGSGFKFWTVGGVVCGIAGAVLGGAAGVPGGPFAVIGGAIVGGAAGAALCGYAPATIDALTRDINFEDAEWKVLHLRGVRNF